ncbi:HMG box protein [Cordyceps fumosorosea ARSEF 2679]|uniref:HMG box protein n=1 Tax=Cordyceps fumosorosea (strain ARSEF 2679) TaxID=1081104 RepID=A0A162MMC3_CORFA|nr:HMG box protein [Cordyceps fumosorosea ARSEF 2679]OAA64080.1 HMG box protein [Cordyceps fumosorosea ARSEF 2679]
MDTGPSSIQSTASMKTREIPSYAANHIIRNSTLAGAVSSLTSRSSGGGNSVRQQGSSVVRPAQLSQQVFAGESSEYLSLDAVNSMTKTLHGPGRDARSRRSQSRERRVDKRTQKPPPSACLTKSLSELATEVGDQGRDAVEIFARRSAEDRRKEYKEAEKKLMEAPNKPKAAPKIKRPLNAFMLYRKAYQEVAKLQCSRTNHQQISTICGNSWNSLETEKLKNEFQRLASTEKQNHEEAFPTYKYDPVQTRKPNHGVMDNPQARDLSDGGSSCPPRRSDRRRSARGSSRARQPFPSEMPDQYQSVHGLHSQPSGSAWEQHQAPPFPAWYNSPRGAGQNPAAPAVDTSYACTSSSLHFQPYSAFVDPCLDPSLRVDVPGSQYGQFLGTNQNMLPGWMNVGGPQNTSTTLVADLDIAGAHAAYLQGAEGDWQVEQLEDGSHFTDWMAHAGNGEHQ